MGGSARLRRVRGIDEATLTALAHCQLYTARDLLSCTTIELVQMLDMREDQVLDLIMLVSKKACPGQSRIGEMLGLQGGVKPAKRRRVVATSLTALDELLQGGVRAGSVTEIVGPPGIGKTQFCHMLSVDVAAIAALKRARTVAMNSNATENAWEATSDAGVNQAQPVSRAAVESIGEDSTMVECEDECRDGESVSDVTGGVLYFNTEASFSAERLIHMACARYPVLREESSALQRTAESVIVVNVTSSEEFLEKLSSLEDAIIDHGVRLLIVDSIAALPRREFDSSGIWQRQALLGKAAALLKSLAVTFDIPVIVTNQATHSGSTGATFDFEHDPFGGHGRHTTAALGAAWAHCVNTRLVFERTEDGRMATIAKSPCCAVWSVPFLIDDRGVIDQPLAAPKQWFTNFWDSAIENRSAQEESGAVDQQHRAVQAQQVSLALAGRG